MSVVQPTKNPPLPPGTVIMPKPNPIPGCPPGLEYLTQIDTLKMKQATELFEIFTGWETNNKYKITNAANQQVYMAMEDTDTCMRICCQAQRGFTIHVVDNMNQEVMRIKRDFKLFAGGKWCAGCCDCCAHEVVIEAPVGTPIGYIKQTGSFWKYHFDVLDEKHETILKIVGPCCIFDGPCCPCDNEFRLMSLDGSTEVGKLTKEYAGFIKEAFSVADNFAIKFPMDLSVKVKGSLLGALILIDFMIFEEKNNKNTF